MALKIIPINRISWQNSRKTDFKKLAYLMDRFWAQSFFSIECKWKILSIFLFTDRLNYGYINLDNWYKARHFYHLVIENSLLFSHSFSHMYVMEIYNLRNTYLGYSSWASHIHRRWTSLEGEGRNFKDAHVRSGKVDTLRCRLLFECDFDKASLSRFE